MELKIAEVLEGGELHPAWCEYRDGFELLLKPSTAEEQRRELRAKPGQSEVSEARRTRYWLGHVMDWRGLTKGGVPLPFTEKTLRTLWDLDSRFNAWLVEECQRIDNFCGQPGSADAGGAPGDHSG